MVVLVVDSVASKASADFYKPCFIPKYNLSEPSQS